jgi:hypothetical protein
MHRREVHARADVRPQEVIVADEAAFGQLIGITGELGITALGLGEIVFA